jgi:hypothetical protein
VLVSDFAAGAHHAGARDVSMIVLVGASFDFVAPQTTVPSRLDSMTTCDLFSASTFADVSDLQIAMQNSGLSGRLHLNH